MTKELPTISIVTPSFNQAQFLEATIQSILSQNYPNLEYIIVDGGSTDKSVEIIKKYEHHLHFWCSSPDNGHYDAINKGFAHATGDILGWLNSDDMYFPWTLKTVSSIMTTLPEVEWLTTLHPCFWDWHGFCVEVHSIPGYSKEAFLDGGYLPWGKPSIGWIQQESTFWRRSLWEKAGSYVSTEFRQAGDFELWARFYHHAELYGTSSPLAGFRMQQKQRSQNKEEYEMEAETVLARMRQASSWSPKLIRSLTLDFKLHRIPKMGKWLYAQSRYRGKRVMRNRSDSPEGFWGVESYHFFIIKHNIP
jgi:glycosyltransferase involved in cell wall biosynthesis